MQLMLYNEFADILKELPEISILETREYIMSYLEVNEPDLALSNLISIIIDLDIKIKASTLKKIENLSGNIEFIESEIVWSRIESLHKMNQLKSLAKM